MGIPRFASWIFNNRTRRLTVSYIPQNVASISFDVNSIIHGCAQIVYNYGEWQSEQRALAISDMSDYQLEKELFKLISDTFLRIIQKVNPKLFLVLAVDGVAPLAKIQQQRCRRYRSATTNPEMRFDPNCITPGTEFMFRLDDYLKKWIQENHHLLPEKVLYSNHMVPGEGEQKIFDYVRNYEISGYGSHIIYGLDADLIILSLICRLKGVYLLREKSLDKNVFERLIHIDEVRDYLYERMGTSTAIDDFAVLSFFLGNDFVPTSPMFSGDMYDTIEYLLDVYYRLGLSLTYTKDGKINIRNLKKLLYSLNDTENDRLKLVYRNLPKLGFKTLELSVKSIFYNGEMKIKLDKDEFHKNWYTKIFSPPLDKPEMAFQLPNHIYLELFEPTNDKIKDLVLDYITSFLWTYMYYKKGTSVVSPNFCYSFGYAPLMEDILRFFPQNISPILKSDEINHGHYSFTVLHQLLAVLPPKSMKSIPTELHKFYHVDSLIYDMFPEKVGVDTEGKDMERLGVVRMAPVEPKRLLGLNLGISDEKLKKYESQKSLMFQRKNIHKDTTERENEEAKDERTKDEEAKDEEAKDERTKDEEIKDERTKEIYKKSKFLQDFERLKRMRTTLPS
jgi:5'-3' exonuclease